MKKFFTILLAIIVAIGVLAYVNKDFRDWLKDMSGQEGTYSRAYKWQDKNGNWHITNTPPPAGIKYEVQEILHNTNIMPDPTKKK